MPIGSGDLVAQLVAEHAPLDADFRVVANPEFLREGNAVHDIFHPDRVVLGAADREAAEAVAALYAPLGAPILLTDLRSAEMIKYASNAFLATKISFINEVARVCERLGADVTVVAEGMGLDPRIGPRFLHAGLGFGGPAPPARASSMLSVSSWRRDPRAARAERLADRDLLPPRRGPREHQVRDVRAGDEQHEADRPEQDQQRLPNPRVDDAFLKAAHDDAPPGVRHRVLLAQTAGERGELRLGLLDRDARPEPRVDAQVAVRAVQLARGQREGRPQSAWLLGRRNPSGRTPTTA